MVQWEERQLPAIKYERCDVNLGSKYVAWERQSKATSKQIATAEGLQPQIDGRMSALEILSLPERVHVDN